MLLSDFNSEFRARCIAFLWRQWAQLGLASATVERRDGWITDPEALILLTGTVGRWDPRLFDEVIDWLAKNASFVNVPRLKSLLRVNRFESGRAVSAMVECVRSTNSRLHWRFAKTDVPTQAEPLFWRDVDPQPVGYGDEDEVFLRFGYRRGVLHLRGLSRRFNAVLPECAILRLRSLMGVSARAEILCYLSTHGPSHPSGIARETGFSQKNVQDTLVDMAASGAVHVGRLEGRKKLYFVTERNKEMFLHDASHLPRWVTWPPLLRALELLWWGLLELENKKTSALLLSSELRRLAQAARPLAERGGAMEALRDDCPYAGEAYTDVFKVDVRRWLAGLLNER
ncbi:MAG: hypothetical protein JXR37_03900 [Kiritimatiellae bacterium]|nr:hypothetical protein [Kiritimatiellia bacterium]